jgi:hypothetical protein
MADAVFEDLLHQLKAVPGPEEPRDNVSDPFAIGGQADPLCS